MSIWRPSTTAILIAGVVIVIIAVAVAFALANFRPTTSVKLGGSVFNVWTALGEPSRVTGLSGVESLKPNGGLLMAFTSDDTWSIWMKDMNISLDIIWLDSTKDVVHIVKNAGPELSTHTTFTPNKPARYVLELAAGSVQKYDINVGDRAEFEVGEIKE
jgi:uncharacterized membrane protein (UPF0127 family)